MIESTKGKLAIEILVVVVLAFAIALLVNQHGDKPKIMLWAWDVPENFSFLNGNRFGVAWLEMTIGFEHGRIEYELRHQPITFPKSGYRLPVVRLEAGDSTFRNFSNSQLDALSAELASLAGRKGIQIDFDARASERKNYARVLMDLQRRLNGRSLSMTALASWCIGDTWIDSLPVTDAVPMLFRMGSEEEWVRNYFNTGHSIRARIASGELGLSTDEPIPNIEMGKQIFLFNPRPWTPKNLRLALERIASRTNE